jgi:hypothetical protein
VKWQRRVPDRTAERRRPAGSNRRHASDHDERQDAIEPAEIIRIAGDHNLGGPSRADDDMRKSDDVAGPGDGEQTARGGRVRRVERHQIRARLLDQSNEADLGEMLFPIIDSAITDEFAC